MEDGEGAKTYKRIKKSRLSVVVRDDKHGKRDLKKSPKREISVFISRNTFVIVDIIYKYNRRYIKWKKEKKTIKLFILLFFCDYSYVNIF